MNQHSQLRLDLGRQVAKSLQDGPIAVEAVLVYGSALRGDAGPNSDVDLLVLTKDKLIDKEYVRGFAPKEHRHLVGVAAYTYDMLDPALSHDPAYLTYLQSESETVFGTQRLDALMNSSLPDSHELSEHVHHWLAVGLSDKDQALTAARRVLYIVHAMHAHSDWSLPATVESMCVRYPELEDTARACHNALLRKKRCKTKGSAFTIRGHEQEAVIALCAGVLWQVLSPALVAA